MQVGARGAGRLATCYKNTLAFENQVGKWFVTKDRKLQFHPSP